PPSPPLFPYTTLFRSGLALAQLADALSTLREASPSFDACHARAIDMSARLARWTEEHGEGEQEADPCASDVLWYELTARGFRLQRTPLDVSGPLREHREKSRAAW